jgi:acyl-coenzyme A thioesterase PaaI-like protein
MRLRPSRRGILRAAGRVVHRTKRMVFCAADLHDSEGVHLASGRCTQVLLTVR